MLEGIATAVRTAVVSAICLIIMFVGFKGILPHQTGMAVVYDAPLVKNSLLVSTSN